MATHHKHNRRDVQIYSATAASVDPMAIYHNRLSFKKIVHPLTTKGGWRFDWVSRSKWVERKRRRKRIGRKASPSFSSIHRWFSLNHVWLIKGKDFVTVSIYQWCSIHVLASYRLSRNVYQFEFRHVYKIFFIFRNKDDEIQSISEVHINHSILLLSIPFVAPQLQSPV